MAYRDSHVWLTVTLAVFRYIAVCHHAIAKRVCTLRHARLAAVCIVLAAVVVCLPTYLSSFSTLILLVGSFDL